MEQKNNTRTRLPLKIGVTGGMGSGKSTVCKIFEFLGIPVYYADDRAKSIMTNDPSVMEQVIDLIGINSYFSDGQLNRAFIASVVFKNPEKLKALNNIVHPVVREDGEKWHQSHSDVPYTIKEAALMIESGNYKLLDKLILVTAPQELRIERIKKRDDTTEEAILERINKQMPENEKVPYAEFIINNDGGESLIKQILAIHQKLKNL